MAHNTVRISREPVTIFIRRVASPDSRLRPDTAVDLTPVLSLLPSRAWTGPATSRSVLGRAEPFALLTTAARQFPEIPDEPKFGLGAA